MTERVVQVALPLPLFEPYTYRVPDTLADRVVPGARVVVPLRNRELVGIALTVGESSDGLPREGGPEQSPPGAPRLRHPATGGGRPLKDLLGAPDPEPALTPPLLRTAEWMAGYYGAPIGLALRAMLPAPLWGASHAVLVASGRAPAIGGLAGEVLDRVLDKGGEVRLDTLARAMRKPLWEVADRLVRVGAVEIRLEPAETERNVATERHLALAGERLTLMERGERFARKPRQRRLYETLEQLGGEASLGHLKEELGFGDAVIRALAGSGLAVIRAEERIRDPFADTPGSPPPGTLTPAQRDAVAGIEAVAPGHGALLFGVTGSGKTLVYLEVVRRALEAGRGAIILVPEIGLTPQAVSRVRGMFGDNVAVLHSALSEGERADAWRALRRGDRRVAVGARSAVFAPVPGLGVVVVDEEHEASYKNGEAPRYHARDVARVRARLEGGRLVLGSATPSLESMTQAGGVRILVGPTGEGPRDGELRIIRLPERVDARPLPPVQLVDLRVEPLVATGRAVPWSEALDAAMSAALERKEQVILLLNRRGYASFLQCPDCGRVPECPDCSISLTLHRVPPALRCHYCGRREPVPSSCSRCGHAIQRARGIGTQQLEELVAERFPRARIARMDLDTTSAKWSHHRILAAIEDGSVDVLLGTQMIAKGMDFPNVTLVGVVDADTALHLPDFRAAERTFQLLAQVAGRAGRGPKGGQVVVQTRSPTHPALRYAAEHDTEGFLAEEEQVRRSPPYPPATTLVNLVASAPVEQAASKEAGRVADWCSALVEKQKLPIAVLGPAPCPLARVQGRWRWHVVLKGPGEEIGRVVRFAAPRLSGKGAVRVVLDRDPVSLL